MNRWIAPEMAPFSNLCLRIADKLPQKLLSTREPFSTRFLLLTLHPKADWAQVLINGPLCTSCAGAAHIVEARGKTGEEEVKMRWPVCRPHLGKHRWQTGEAARSLSKTAPAAQIRHPPVRNRLPARIFTVDIPSRRRKIQAVRFSNSASLFVPVLRWERKKPA